MAKKSIRSDMQQVQLTKPNSVQPEEPATDSTFPVVGVGASAGGLDAFRELLKYLPADTGMAFVLVQHLDPHHESLLCSLLSVVTSMPVHEVADNMRIEPNHVYVIPPNTSMGILHDSLQLVQRQNVGGRYLPVDWFLRTLAEDRGAGAIGVILSGTASDGTLGLKAVKAAGGITFAQSETTAEYFGMPGNAIASGCVDFVLSPQEIAHELGSIARHPYLLHFRPTDGDEITGTEDQLSKVFLLLRSHTGHDFTYYKHTTIKRRIKRRMLVHKLERLKDYVNLLEQNPAEVAALFHDMLINVTSFFRDPETFEALRKEIFPKLMENRPPDLPLRIWVPGCSTGEEAYSLAITLLEYLGDRSSNTSVQIFATDIDSQAIEKARRGIYAERITEEVNTGRLQRFFVKVSSGHQVSKTIRDLCVFAEQDVTKDPPFSRLDLVCCRNMLIYLGTMLQKKVLLVFHYALQPNGFLMLGNSESIGSQADLFRLVDKKNKIYTKKSVAVRGGYDFSRPALHGQQPSFSSSADLHVPAFDIHHEADQLVLASYGPPGVVINQDMEILQFRGETGPYLNPTPGNASLNLFKMARRELAVELQAAVRRVNKEGKSVSKEGIRVRCNGGEKIIHLQIIPFGDSSTAERCLLVLFEETRKAGEEQVEKRLAQTDSEESQRVIELERELSSSREYMQSIIEEQETSNEELKSANEEIQSTNEELQSTNEELETAKEELQSTNEELATVNEELENRNLELGAAINDLTNLLASVNLPILMLGEDLRIRQFTPQAEKLFNLIETDLGRPINQIRPNIEIPGLEQMVSEVIDTMATRSLEVQDHNGRWYKLRARPYKTLDNRIEGVVITFIDIDDIKNAEYLRKMQTTLLESEQRLQDIINNSTTVIVVKDPEGRYLLVNRTAADLLGFSMDRIIGRTDHELAPKAYADIWSRHDREVLRRGEAMEFEEFAPFKGREHAFLAVKFPLKAIDGKVYAVGGIATDITQRVQSKQALERLATVVRDSNDAITMQGFDGSIQAWNPAAERMYGWSEQEALKMNIRDMLPEAEYPAIQRLLEQVRQGEAPESVEVSRNTKAGDTVRMRLTMSLLLDKKGQATAVATTERRIL